MQMHGALSPHEPYITEFTELIPNTAKGKLHNTAKNYL
jgi:hypothetical protein